MEKIGLMMVVRNEAKSLRQFFDYHLPYMDEVAICDQQSDDGTWKIILEYKAKAKIPFFAIRDKKWGHCEPSRQKTADLLSASWILYLDPDEQLSIELLEKIHTLVENKDCDGYLMPRHNIFNVQVYDSNVPIEPKWLQVIHPSKDYQLRLTRRAVSSFNAFLHNRVRVNSTVKGARIIKLDYFIEHEKTLGEQLEDNSRYANIPIIQNGGKI